MKNWKCNHCGRIHPDKYTCCTKCNVTRSHDSGQVSFLELAAFNETLAATTESLKLQSDWFDRITAGKASG